MGEDTFHDSAWLAENRAILREARGGTLREKRYTPMAAMAQKRILRSDSLLASRLKARATR